VTAGASDKVYDGLLTSPGVPTITSGTLAAGDTAPAWVETYDSKNVGTTHVMTVTPAPVNDGNGGANYTVTYNTIATGVITKAPTIATVNVLPNPQQYSDKVNFRASLTPAAINGTAPATGVTFKVSSQVMGTASFSVSNGMLQASLSNVALLETVVGQMAPGSRTVTAEFTDVNPNFSVTDNTTTLTINKEDARATYTGALFVGTASATSGRAIVTLAATIQISRQLRLLIRPMTLSLEISGTPR